MPHSDRETENSTESVEVRIRRCAEWIAESSRVVVFTGAGISTDSGLPDYRGPDGVWTRRDKGLPPPRMTKTLDKIEPNAGHTALVDLQKMGKLWFLISQNVDNLHLTSGINPGIIAELHGNRAIMKCLNCDRRFSRSSLSWDEEKWGKAYRFQPPVEGQPYCDCGGRIISSIVNFGDPMPEREMSLALRHARQADLFLAVGSSLAVAPANTMPLLARRNGARLIIVNRGDTDQDGLADLLFREGVGDVLPPVAELAARILRNPA